MKKNIYTWVCLIAVLCVSLTMALTGCGESKPGPATGTGEIIIPEIPENLKGTEISIAHYYDPKNGDNGATDIIDIFMQKTGINVKIDIYPQSEYYTKLASLVAGGEAPDIFFDNNNFPMTVSLADPLERTKLDLSDAFWDQSVIKHSTINGKAYGLDAAGGLVGGGDLLYYNKTMFREYGIKTPDEYINEGKWTWEVFREVCEEVRSANKKFEACGNIFLNVLAPYNTDLIKFSGGVFSSNLTDPALLAITRVHGELLKDEYEEGTTDAFKGGTVGMQIVDHFGLKKSGYFQGMTDTVGYVDLPALTVDGKEIKPNGGYYQAYCIGKGSKNPEAAGLFLKTYLNPKNWDLDSVFVSEEAKEYHIKMKARPSDKISYMVSPGVLSLVDEFGIYAAAYGIQYNLDPAQITTAFEECSPYVDSAVKRANELFSGK